MPTKTTRNTVPDITKTPIAFSLFFVPPHDTLEGPLLQGTRASLSALPYWPKKPLSVQLAVGLQLIAVKTQKQGGKPRKNPY